MNFKINNWLAEEHLLLKSKDFKKLIKSLPCTSSKQPLKKRKNFNCTNEYIKLYFGIYFQEPNEFDLTRIPNDVLEEINKISKIHDNFSLINEYIDRYIECYCDVNFKMKFLQQAYDNVPDEHKNKQYYISKELDRLYKNVSDSDKSYILNICLKYAYYIHNIRR